MHTAACPARRRRQQQRQPACAWSMRQRQGTLPFRPGRRQGQFLPAAAPWPWTRTHDGAGSMSVSVCGGVRARVAGAGFGSSGMCSTHAAMCARLPEVWGGACEGTPQGRWCRSLTLADEGCPLQPSPAVCAQACWRWVHVLCAWRVERSHTQPPGWGIGAVCMARPMRSLQMCTSALPVLTQCLSFDSHSSLLAIVCKAGGIGQSVLCWGQCHMCLPDTCGWSACCSVGGLGEAAVWWWLRPAVAVRHRPCPGRVAPRAVACRDSQRRRDVLRERRRLA
jgi:hypothetical protein